MIKKVEATRSKRLGHDFPRLSPEEKLEILKKNHPDYIERRSESGSERRSKNRDERKNSNLYAEKRQKYIGRNRCRYTDADWAGWKNKKRTTVIKWENGREL